MEENPTDSLEFILQIEAVHKDFLAQIRHYKNLKVASAENFYWVAGFTTEQINSPEVLSIPFISIFQVVDNKLFCIGNTLPERRCPSFLWTPINLVFPLRLPKQNHNYFGIEQKITIQILPSSNYKAPYALKTSIQSLKNYLFEAPSIRYQNLQWVILNSLQEDVLIIGQPLLPIQGQTFWKYSGTFCDFLIPSGYDFNLNTAKSILEEKYFSSSENLIIWSENSEFSLIPKVNITDLTLSSLRLTDHKLKLSTEERSN